MIGDLKELGRELVGASYLKGDFVLRSGKRSNRYFDKFLFETDPALLRRLGRHLAQLVPAETQRLAAPELGAVLLGGAVSMETGLPLVLVRKAPKGYGTSKQIEGRFEPGERVTVIEDVVTTGGDSLRSAQVLRDAGVEVIHLVVVLDRGEGGEENIRGAGIPYSPLFLIRRCSASPISSLTESSRTNALVIEGGIVHTPEGPREVDVHVADGVIIGVGNAPAPSDAQVVDARGMYVLPGGIDVHVHSRDPGFPDKEDFGTLTDAAAAGGVTTVIDMPNTVPAVDGAGMLEGKAALARRKARVDFGLWGLVRSGTTPDELEGLAAAGATGFKAYLGYAFSLSRKQVVYSPDLDDPALEPPPDYGTLARVAPVIANLGLPLVIHAEDPGILRAFRRPLETYADLLAARPDEAEAVAIAAAAEIAGASGVRLHVAHLSSAAGLAAAKEAMGAGAPLSLETCPQYLWLCDEDYGRVGTAMKVFPPIRTAGDRDALVEGLSQGTIEIVATDHARGEPGRPDPLRELPGAGSPAWRCLARAALGVRSAGGAGRPSGEQRDDCGRL